MKQQKIVFDVDQTLINEKGEPRYDVIDIYRLFKRLGWAIFVHSGSGVDYAKRWCEKLGIEAVVVQKGEVGIEYDIAVDDMEIEINQPTGRYINAKIFLKV